MKAHGPEGKEKRRERKGEESATNKSLRSLSEQARSLSMKRLTIFNSSSNSVRVSESLSTDHPLAAKEQATRPLTARLTR